MPDYSKPLTQEEKDAIIARHHFLVDKMNETLGGVLKYEDEDILKRLDDPEEVEIYRMYEEHKRRDEERQRIYDSLEAKYGKGTLSNNPMGRIFKYSLKLSGSDKDNEYNEKIYQQLINNPEKLAYTEYNKLLNIDATEIARLGNNKVNQAYFYMEHEALCEQAYALSGVVNAYVTHASEGIKEARSLKKPFEDLNAYGNLVKQGGFEYLACPSLTQEQAVASMMCRELFMGDPYPELTKVINGKAGMNKTDTPNDLINKFKNYGIETNDPDLFIKYKAVRTNPQNGERQEVNFDELFVKDDPNVRLEKRSKEEIFQIRAFNSVYQHKYVESFQGRIASKLNQIVFDVEQLADERKGNWVERNILRSTSPEWTAFVESFRQFNDPNHANYGRKDILREKAEAYQQHKRDQGYEKLSDMKGTSLKRSTLCQAVIDTCKVLEKTDDLVKEDIDIEINTGYRGKVGMIINSDEVDIFANNKNEPVEEEDDLDISVEQLDKTFDNNI